MNDITIFADESGVIQKGVLSGKDLFIISLVIVNDRVHVKRVFDKSLLSVVKKSEKLTQEFNTNHEVKGSHVSESLKDQIYSKVLDKCSENLEIGIIVLDNVKSEAHLRSNTSRAFNFMIKLFMQNFFVPHSPFKNDIDKLDFFIDERNVATGAKFNLEELLNSNFNMPERFTISDITVKYVNSSITHLVQLSDFIANTYFRYYQKNIKEAKANIDLIDTRLCYNRIFQFPMECIF